MQTIYYISDTRGHRISINVPFNEDNINRNIRPAPTRKPQNHAENRKRFQLAVDENKLYEENRIEESQRQGRIQASRKADVPKVQVKAKAEAVAKPVTEAIEEVTTAVVKVEDEIKSEDDTEMKSEDEKPEEQVSDEEKPENDDHTEESVKDEDYADEK
jgi:hypothetical protein